LGRKPQSNWQNRGFGRLKNRNFLFGAAFTKKFGLILSKTPDRSGGAGRKGGWGERNSRPALAFAAAEFRASKTGAPPKILLQ